MKKRVVALLLCLVMALSVFMTGCSEETDQETIDKINEEASINNVTLSMWVVSENEVSAETAAAVTAALNEITEDKLKTRLAITYYTMDQYESKLTAAIEAFDNTAVAPSTGNTTNSNTNADGSFYEPTYPALLENQVDIIYIEGEEMYTNYLNKGWLASLESEITSASANKTLQEYISSVVLNAVKLNGKNIYAIPNNNLVGEYTYMLLNRELMDEFYGGYANNVDSFFDTLIYNYLDTVFERKSTDDYVLIDADYEDCLELLAHYWNFDSEDYALLEDFSVFGHCYTDKDTLSRGSIELGYSNLFANESFTDAFLKLNKFEANGYFGDAEADGKDAAVKIVKCDLLSLDQYTDEYYPVIVSYPTLTEEDLFDNGMFGVCAKSVNVSRSMQVITYINTNAAVRNTLYYGAKDVHYGTQEREVDGEKITVAYRLNNDYQMSMTRTGNIFLVYPTVDLENEENSMDLDVWATVKQQNYEALISPTLGFKLGDQAINRDLNAYLNGLNAGLTDVMDALKTEEDWFDEMVVLVNELGILLDSESEATLDDFVALKDYLESDAFKNLVTDTVDGEEVGVNDLETLRDNLKLAMSTETTKVDNKDVYSPYGAYKQWLSACGFTVKTK